MSRDAGRFGKILSLQHWDIMICRWILSAIARHSKDLYSILLQYLKVLLPVIPKGLRRVFCTSEVEQIGEANMSVDCISTPRRKRPSDIFSNDNSQTKGSRPTQQTMNDCVSQLQRQNKLSSTVRQEKRPLARDEPLQSEPHTVECQKTNSCSSCGRGCWRRQRPPKTREESGAQWSKSASCDKRWRSRQIWRGAALSRG